MLWRFLLYVTFASVALKSTTAFSMPTYAGKYLDRHELKVLQVDWFGCIEQCRKEPSCVSYNFHAENNTCQLNSHGVEETCMAEQELASYDGWVFHQIKPTTKKVNKVKSASCPCNCGSADQCFVEPGLGDVPEKAAHSCWDILQRRGPVPNGAYYLNTPSQIQHVYCNMEPIDECGDERGWTLVMKIDGKKDTFKYNSKLWVDENVFQEENGASLDQVETKLGTFVTVTIEKICFGMSLFSAPIKWISLERRDGKSLFAVFKDSIHDEFNIEKSKWQSLIPRSALDSGQTKDGFNVVPIEDGAKARIGIIAYKPADDPPTSYIGFGTYGSLGMPDNITCGNVQGSSSIPTFGYILVR